MQSASAAVGTALPGAGAGAWAVVGMGATMAAAMRSPLTAIVFSLELTHQVEKLLPLLAACTVGHPASALWLRRDLLTERLARRGHHVNREYEVDPLQALFLREVMDVDPHTVTAAMTTEDVYARLPEGSPRRRQRLYPVTRRTGRCSAWPATTPVASSAWSHSSTCSPRTGACWSRRACASGTSREA